jgi:hypothetical protein
MAEGDRSLLSVEYKEKNSARQNSHQPEPGEFPFMEEVSDGYFFVARNVDVNCGLIER